MNTQMVLPIAALFVFIIMLIMNPPKGRLKWIGVPMLLFLQILICYLSIQDNRNSKMIIEQLRSTIISFKDKTLSELSIVKQQTFENGYSEEKIERITQSVDLLNMSLNAGRIISAENISLPPTEIRVTFPSSIVNSSVVTKNLSKFGLQQYFFISDEQYMNENAIKYMAVNSISYGAKVNNYLAKIAALVFMQAGIPLQAILKSADPNDSLTITLTYEGSVFMRNALTAKEVYNFKSDNILAEYASGNVSDGVPSILAFKALIVDGVIQLSWIAPSNVEICGYVLRYSNSPITDKTFADAIPITDVPLPHPSQLQVYHAFRPKRGQRVYFGIKVQSTIGEESALSTTSVGL